MYDFSGNACDGYELKFRQVSQLRLRRRSAGAQRSAVDHVGKRQCQQISLQLRKISFNERRTDVVDGQAERTTKAVAIESDQAEGKELEHAGRCGVPHRAYRRIIAAAREGKSLLEFPVFDGAETGDKLYNTLTVIGHPIAPGEKMPDDAVAKVPDFAKLTRWPVTISYFDNSDQKSEQSGEQTPVYSIGFELYERTAFRARLS